MSKEAVDGGTELGRYKVKNQYLLTLLSASAGVLDEHLFPPVKGDNHVIYH